LLLVLTNNQDRMLVITYSTSWIILDMTF
jgi:hypothetical protein